MKTDKRARHLLVAISSHGYGHAAQALPVVNALRQRLPNLRVSLRTTLPERLLAARLSGSWTYLQQACDLGMLMASPTEVLAEESAAAYRELHHNWESKVQDEAQTLRGLAPDLVLADVPYLPLAGAAMAGIPAVALCCLNWADIYHHYCGMQPEAEQIREQMLQAYNSAAAFLQTEPSMPMPAIRNGRRIGPIAQSGISRRSEINVHLGLAPGERLVMVTLGGIPARIDAHNWPRLPDIRWIIDGNISGRGDMIGVEALGLSFQDLVCSCDAIVTKPGYGMFAEAACNGIPLLYIRRDGWPEEPYLVRWLAQHGRCLEISRSQLERGDLGDALNALWMAPTPAPTPARGIDEAAGHLAHWLEQPDMTDR